MLYSRSPMFSQFSSLICASFRRPILDTFHILRFVASQIPSGKLTIPMEKHHFQWIDPRKMVVFKFANCQSLPEGISEGRIQLSFLSGDWPKKKRPVIHGGFHSHGGTPIAGWFISQTMKMDDLGVHPFQETFIQASNIQDIPQQSSKRMSKTFRSGSIFIYWSVLHIKHYPTVIPFLFY